MASIGRIRLSVMDPDKMIFDGEITNLFLQGDTGEFEILPHHYPILSLLRTGEVIIDWKYSIPIKNGLVRFFKNDCVLFVELADD